MRNTGASLKRTIDGTYVSEEPFHMRRYLDEQSFRYNERKGTDRDRFMLALSQAPSKRLTYVRLTSKEAKI